MDGGGVMSCVGMLSLMFPPFCRHWLKGRGWGKTGERTHTHSLRNREHQVFYRCINDWGGGTWNKHTQTRIIYRELVSMKYIFAIQWNSLFYSELRPEKIHDCVDSRFWKAETVIGSFTVEGIRYLTREKCVPKASFVVNAFTWRSWEIFVHRLWGRWCGSWF